MKKYNSYHSSVKICYALGIQNHLLPDNFTSTIKPSTAHYWKNDNPHKYLGSEFSSSINNNIDDLQIIYDQKVEQLKKMFVIFCKVYLTILNFIGEKEFKVILKNNRNTIVNLIENITKDNKDKNLICKFLKITPHSYQTWKRYQNYYCEFSLINLCFKKIPQQISRNEIQILKSFMSNKRFYHWSFASVWGLAFKQGKTSLARGTWYRYSKILGLSKKRNQFDLTQKMEPPESINTQAAQKIGHLEGTN